MAISPDREQHQFHFERGPEAIAATLLDSIGAQLPTRWWSFTAGVLSTPRAGLSRSDFCTATRSREIAGSSEDRRRRTDAGILHPQLQVAGILVGRDHRRTRVWTQETERNLHITVFVAFHLHVHRDEDMHVSRTLRG